MWKNCKVVMLSTNEKSNLFLSDNMLFISDSSYSGVIDRIVAKRKSYQHLYITSDEEFIYPSKGIKYYDGEGNIKVSGTGAIYCLSSKNIIATTDKNLELPELSQVFITKYIEEYNKGDTITNVLVEYKTISTIPFSKDAPYRDRGYIDVLDINPDNTIVTKLIKESWNRNELISLFKDYRSGLMHITQKEIDYTNKWIKENL